MLPSPRRSLSLILSTFAALPFPLVTLMVSLDISGTDRLSRPLWGGQAAPVGLGCLLAVALVYHAALSLERPLHFAVAGTLAMLAVQALACIAGLTQHRDYFSTFFSNTVVFMCLFLFWLNGRHESSLAKRRRREIGTAFRVVFVLWVLWIFLMGYAIATRSEPRPIEALMYNAYNSLLALALFLLSNQLVLSSYRTVTVGPAGIAVDGRSLDALLGESGVALLRTFLETPDRRATCQRIAGAERRDGGKEPPAPCERCDAEGAKATACGLYRSTYNRVLALKKVLEFAEIGTILPPRNKMHILAEGWGLLLFENVRIKKA